MGEFGWEKNPEMEKMAENAPKWGKGHKAPQNPVIITAVLLSLGLFLY